MKTKIAMVKVLLVAGSVALLAAVLIPNFLKAREAAKRKTCLNNLMIVQGAKESWALENMKADVDVATWSDLTAYLKGGMKLVCPAGGLYSIRSVTNWVTCSVSGHLLTNRLPIKVYGLQGGR